MPAFAPTDRTRVAAELLAELAFGETSETYRRLVLEEQVVEFLDANVDEHRDPGLLDITTRVKDPAKVDYVLGVIDATIAGVRAAPPDARAPRGSAAAPEIRLRHGAADAGRASRSGSRASSRSRAISTACASSMRRTRP